MSTSPAAPDEDSEYEAEFTSEQAHEVTCNRCSRVFPAGTKLRLMHSKKDGHSDRLFCPECFEYYRSKGTTVRRTPGTSNRAPSAPSEPGVHSFQGNFESHSVVRRQVAAAQRIDGAYPMVAVGEISQHMGQVNLNVNHGAPSQRPITQQNKKTKPIRVQLNLLPINLHSTLPFPALKSKPLVNPGYQEAHQFYNEMRAHFANKAYSGVANVELIVVKVWMMMRVPNRKTPAPVSDIFEALSDIPVHIGASDLKWVLYHALLPHYVKWSKGFPLHPDDCQVRNKLWVELVPKHPDVDAVAEHFFTSKGKNKAKVFTPKQGIDLYLVITHEKYDAILQHLSDIEEGYQCNENGSASLSQVVLPAKKSTGKRKARDFDTENIAIANGADEASPHPSLDQVKNALLLQQPPRKKNMRSLFEIITITAQFFRPPSRPSFAELVQNPEFLLHPENFPPRQVKISYPPSSKPLQGAFKIAHFGHTDIPMFGNSTRVCIKQTFSTSEDSKKRVVYQSQVQAANLSVELNCLGWASALMDLVYKFMDKEVAVRGFPAFEVPQMRYVQAGLAISNDAEGRQNAYLLEEFIDSEAPGWFVKYLNNNSAKPYRFKDEERSIRAEFLSFAQHIQFIETGGQAFVSDLQGKFLGGRTLLTDPQIITNPTLIGFLFGEGNTNFETFTAEHRFNRFCNFYQLPPPVNTAQSAAETQTYNESLSIISSPGSDSSFPRNPIPVVMSVSNSGTAPMDISEAASVH